MNAKPESAVVNLGRHLLAEFYDCNSNILNNVQRIEEVMNEAAVACGATVVQSNFHLFNPYGVSGVVVISESHLAIHTWPEYGYAAVDLFTCGSSCDPKVAYDYLKEKLGAKSAFYSELKRGLLNLTNEQMIQSPFQLEAQMASVGAATVKPDVAQGATPEAMQALNPGAMQNVTPELAQQVCAATFVGSQKVEGVQR